MFAITSVNAQTFSYSYIDPCTGNVKTISVPSTGITVSYYGQLGTFAASDFFNGQFESWTNNVYASFGGVDPCASIIGMPTSTNIAQGSAVNFISIINSLSSLSDMGSIAGTSNILSGAVNGAQGSSGGDNNNSNNKNNNGNSSSGGSSNNSSSSGSNSSTAGGNSGTSSGSGSNSNSSGSSSGSSSGGSQGGGSGGSEGGGGSSGGGNTGGTSGQGEETNPSSGGAGSGSQSETQETQEESQGQTNILGSSVNSSSNASSGDGNQSNGGNGSSKGSNKPSVLASSDLVGFNFKNSDVDYGAKINGGYTALKWDGSSAHGVMFDYTSAQKGPNISAFYARLKPNRIDLISTSIALGFETQRTIYGTIAIGQMWNLDEQKRTKAVYMLTASYGKVYGAEFLGTAAIVGGMHDLKIGKRVDMKLMGLYVYAPYVSYYNDLLLKSPHVILPIIGTNLSVTKKFKFNINGGGAWAIKEQALNYTVMVGTRLLL